METNNIEWKGYTLDEIKVKRMVNLARLEIEKSKLRTLTQPITQKAGFLKNSSPIFKKITGALSYADYVFIAYKIFSKGFKLFRRR